MNYIVKLSRFLSQNSIKKFVKNSFTNQPECQNCWCSTLHQGVEHMASPKCKACKHFKIYKAKEIIICLPLIILCILLVFVFGTPQGVIRTHILIEEGISTATTAKIQYYCQEDTPMHRKITYNVTVNGEEEQWKIKQGQYVYYIEAKHTHQTNSGQ